MLVLYNNYTIYEDNITHYSNEINLVNHVPYLQVLDFIKAIIGTFALGLFPDPDTKTMLLIPWRDLIKQPFSEDLTYAASEDWEYDNDKDFISIFKYDIDTNDDLSIDYSGSEFRNFIFGEGLTARSMYDFGQFGARYAYGDNTYYLIPVNVPPSFEADYIAQDLKAVKKTGSIKEYVSPLIPMWNSWAIHLDGVTELGDDLPFQEWMVPHIKHIGYSTRIDIVKTTLMSFRPMFYRGFQPAIEGIDQTYPMAGITEYNIRGEQVGDLRLTMDRERGIYDTWWKLPYEMLAGKKQVERTMLLTRRFLANFKFQNKYRVENQNIFFTSLKFAIGNNTRGVYQVETTYITSL